MKELEIIKDLMDELCEKMKYSSEDFEERLGRKKDEGLMKKTGEHYGVNKEPGGKPEDMGIPVAEKGDPGEDDDADEEEKLRGRIMRLKA